MRWNKRRIQKIIKALYKDFIKHNKSKHPPSITNILSYINYIEVNEDYPDWFDYRKKISNKHKELVCELARTKTTKEVENIIIANISSCEWNWSAIFLRGKVSEDFLNFITPYKNGCSEIIYQKLSEEYIANHINENNYYSYLDYQKVPLSLVKEFIINDDCIYASRHSRQNYYSKYAAALMGRANKELYLKGKKELSGEKLEFLEIVAKQVFGKVEYFLMKAETL